MPHRRRPVRWFAAVAALLLLLAVPPPGRADDGPDALKFFETRLAAMAKSCADKLWEAASSATAGGFHQMASETADEILEVWYPDHGEARKLLGFARKGKDWASDPDANVKRQNTKNEKESQKSFDDRLAKWREQRRKVDAFLAAKYAALGAECAAKGYAEQAQKANERALNLDPDCEPARKAMGFSKFGLLWVTKEKAAAIQQATIGKPVDGKSKLEEALGVTLHKVQSAHFRIEDDAKKEALPEAAKHLETLYAYYLADIGKDPTHDVFGGKVVELCVVSTKPLWDKWVDHCSGFKDKAWLKEANTYRNLTDLRTGTLRVETAEHVDTRDPLLHHAAHILNLTLWKAPRWAWIDEGLAYYYTVKVQETTRTHCVEKQQTEYAQDKTVGGDKDWTVSERWKIYLKGVVQKKGDAELRKIMGQPLATLDLASSVKAWGVISYLMDKKREKFLAFLTAMRDQKHAAGGPPPEPQEDVFQRIFAQGIEEVDREWRAYAVRAY